MESRFLEARHLVYGAPLYLDEQKGSGGMMEKLWEYLRGMTVILSDIALCGLAFLLAPLLFHWDMGLALHLWILTAAVQLLIGSGLVAAGVSWSVYLVVQTVAITAGTGVILWGCWFPVYGADLRIFLGACTVTVGIHNAWVVCRLPGSNGMMRYVDTLIVVMAFYLYAVFQTGGVADQRILTAALAALALNLLMVNHLRTGGEGGTVIRGAGAGSKLVLAAIFLGCAAVTGVLVGAASGQVHSAVDVLLLVLYGIYRVLEVIFGVIGQVLAVIILFLISLFPAAAPAVRENAAVKAEQEVEELLGETGAQISGWIVAGFLAALGLVFVAWVLYQLKDVRISRPAKPSRRRRVVRKSHLLAALAAMARGLWERVSFEWAYLRHRNTPQGLFVLAERVGRQNQLVRRMDESPGAYVRRFGRELERREAAGADTNETASTDRDVGEYAGGSAGSQASMVELLAVILDEMFYAGRTEVPESFDSRLCERQIRGFCGCPDRSAHLLR